MGLWHESIDTNQTGATVDDLFFKPHAMDFLVHSYLQTGQAEAAKRVVDSIKTIEIIPHILDAFAAAAMRARRFSCRLYCALCLRWEPCPAPRRASSASTRSRRLRASASRVRKPASVSSISRFFASSSSMRLAIRSSPSRN